MIQIDFTEILLKNLKSKGWRQNGGYAIRGNPRVLERNNKRIAVVKPLKVDPFKILDQEIDIFFKSLISIIQKNGINDVFLPGGGTIPIPQFFLDYCSMNGIKIHIITQENIDQYSNWES
jgi:hypothetical protein